MAKLARNRLMYFGSWTGAPIAESAVATFDGSITAATVTAATFGTAVNKVSGEYVFTSDGTDWSLKGTKITTTTYGLTVTGSPTSGDTITVKYTAASGGWDALGKDNEDLSKELNPDTEAKKNVLGEASFNHSGYQPEVNLDPYYADPSRKLYDHLLECAVQEKFAESDLLGYFAEAYFTDANPERQVMTGFCFVRQAWIVPQSTGGDTAGLGIPFTVNPIGPMTKMAISYDMTTNEASITPWTED